MEKIELTPLELSMLERNLRGEFSLQSRPMRKTPLLQG